MHGPLYVAGQRRLQESLSLAQLIRHALTASATRQEALPSALAFADPPAKQTQTSMADNANLIFQPLREIKTTFLSPIRSTMAVGSYCKGQQGRALTLSHFVISVHVSPSSLD